MIQVMMIMITNNHIFGVQMNKNAVADEIAVQMKMNMRPQFPTSEEKLSAVFNHLNLAAEYFDEAGNDKFANLVTNFMVRFAQG